MYALTVHPSASTGAANSLPIWSRAVDTTSTSRAIISDATDVSASTQLCAFGSAEWLSTEWLMGRDLSLQMPARRAASEATALGCRYDDGSAQKDAGPAAIFFLPPTES